MTYQLVLLADGDTDSRELYAMFLKARGYGIEHAEDGRDALAKAISEPPDAIVTETRLPGINGYELCRLLRSDRDTRAVPIVVLTGEARVVYLARARDAGADSILVKPCLPEVLFTELQRLAQSIEIRDRAAAARRPCGDSTVAELLADVKFEPQDVVFDHHRHETLQPPMLPPTLRCPQCDRSLIYERSFVGISDTHAEQWDEFLCAAGCGRFEFGQRARKLLKQSA
jgi:two-component system, cell cycle response regulator DivK